MIWSKSAHTPCSLDPTPPYTTTGENWAARPTPTGDQLEIVRHLKTLGAVGKRVLHVGVGCSSVARKLLPDAELVHGITVNPKEKVLADAFGIEDYRVAVGDKHTFDVYENFWPQKYDWIVENALTVYACCAWHLVSLLEILTSQLAEGGTLWTHQGSLGIHVNQQYKLGDIPYPLMDLSELEQIEAQQPLECEVVGGIIAIRRRDR